MDLRALIFMPALVGAVVVGFVFLLYASHYYLSVLEGTAAGAKEIPWLRESAIDHFPKFCYLAWLIGLWFGPAYLIGRRVGVGADSPWLELFVPLAVMWVCYPVGQLSSLSASSPWMPLVPDVFARLAQKPRVVVEFLVLSAAVLACFGVGFRWAFQTAGSWERLAVGSPLVVVSAMMYARLLGRLAFVLRFTKALFPKKVKKARKPTAEAEEKPTRPKKQPRELPPVETPDGELSGYDVRFDDDSPPAPRKRVRAEVAEPDPEPVAKSPRPPAPDHPLDRARVWTDEDDEKTTAYGVHEAEVKTGEGIPPEVIEPPAEEVRLLSRDDVPKKPRRAWRGLLAFLGQPGTVWAVFVASGLCSVAGGMVRIARAYNPVAGESR